MQYGFWLKNDGRIADVTNTTHIRFVTSQPELFGLTSERIKEVYDEFGEIYGSEGIAKERIAKNLYEDGWTRIRKYEKSNEYWEIQCDDPSKRKKEIHSFLKWALEKNLMSHYDEIRVVSFSNSFGARDTVSEFLRNHAEKGPEISSWKG